eukprot:jgi/Undpi1/5650/HiC_scaffold_2.g00924.m1
MKYGKQLQTNAYAPWMDKYLAYGKIKRMLKRYHFVKMQRDQGEEDAEIKFAKQEGMLVLGVATALAAEALLPLPSPDTEKTPLNSKQQGTSPPLTVTTLTGRGAGTGTGAGSDSSEEAGPPAGSSWPTEKIADEHAEGKGPRLCSVNEKERVSSRDRLASSGRKRRWVTWLKEVDQFYKGKNAELDQILRGFEERGHMLNSWAVPSGNTLAPLFEAYTEITALGKFVEMNGEGFRKIVKNFLEKLQGHKFYQSKAAESLLERVQGLVSRDKLLDMKRHAQLAHMDASDKSIFPAIKGDRDMSLLDVFPVVVLLLLLRVLLLLCLRMLVFVTTLWVTEAVPYFVTALLIPVLVVLMDIMENSDGGATGREREEEGRRASAHVVLSYMVDHTTILIMGGCEIELRIAALLQKHLGHRPRLFILGIMYLGLVLSTLISNHTAPVLCVFAKTLLLGLAFACNFGGMVTPISSMQNVVARQALENAGLTISFGIWIAVGLPFCVLGVFVAWCLLCIIVDPTDVEHIPMIVYSRGDVLSRKNVFIVSLTLLTIFGWSTIGATEDFFGDLGIIALLFIVDFNSFSWHTLFLLGGGNVLGKAIASSQLLDYLAHCIDNRFLLLVEVVSVTMCISTFVSHTVAALILMPIIVEVGVKCGNPVLLGMGAALAVSSGCALPFSSFPNVTSLLVTDDYNRKYLAVRDFVTSGLPMSLLSVAMICTLGYGLIDWIMMPRVMILTDDDGEFDVDAAR